MITYEFQEDYFTEDNVIIEDKNEKYIKKAKTILKPVKIIKKDDKNLDTVNIIGNNIKNLKAVKVIGKDEKNLKTSKLKVVKIERVGKKEDKNINARKIIRKDDKNINAAKINKEANIAKRKNINIDEKKIVDKKKETKTVVNKSKAVKCQCDLCGNIYSWATSLNRHRRQCESRLAKRIKLIPDTEDENYSGSVRRIKLTKKEMKSERMAAREYEVEMKKFKTPDGLYACWDCGRKYHWASSLSRHRTIQCGPRSKRKYVCKMCAYRTGYRGNFMRHLRTPRHKMNNRLLKIKDRTGEEVEIDEDDDDDEEIDEDIIPKKFIKKF